MHRRVFLIEHKKTYFGHASPKRSTVFAFKTRRQVEWVRDHVCGARDAVSEISDNRYHVKTRFNPDNFLDGESSSPGEIAVLERRFGGLLSRCRAVDISVGVVDTIVERDDGDIEIVLHPFGKSRASDVNLLRSSLETLYRQ